MSLLLPRRRLYTNVAALGKASGGGGGDAAQTTAFLARADAITTVGATERAMYKALINGLVSTAYSGGGTLFSAFDSLRIYATDTQAHALLNLIQNLYNPTINGSLTFTADRGFAGNGTNTNYIDTNFNPSTATTPKYTQDSAHYSVWSVTAGVEGNTLTGNDVTSTHVYPDFGGPGTYMRINDSASSGQISATPDGSGFYLASRTGPSNRDGYWNASPIGNANSATSTTVANANFRDICVYQGNGSTKQVAMASTGAKLNSTDASNFYTLVRAAMNTVGVP